MDQKRYEQFATIREEIDDKIIVHVFGDIDLSCSSALETAIDEAAASGAGVIVNLEHCCYMDSSALTALIRAVKRYGPGLEAVVTERSPIERLMRITRFEEVLPITFSKYGKLRSVANP